MDQNVDKLEENIALGGGEKDGISEVWTHGFRGKRISVSVPYAKSQYSSDMDQIWHAVSG